MGRNQLTDPIVGADLPSRRLCGSRRILMANGKTLEQFGMTSLSNLPVKARYPDGPGTDAIDVFPSMIRSFLKKHRPSRMPFFQHMANLPFPVASDPVLLGQIHLIYQSAMHATRAAVYYLPHLDSPALRRRKLQILIDDDGLPAGDTHHYQLTRAFLNIGEIPTCRRGVRRSREIGRSPRCRNGPLCPTGPRTIRTIARSLVRGRSPVG